VVIDWSNATEGDPDLDLAVSALIMAEVAVGGADIAAFAGVALAAFLDQVGVTDAALERAVAMRSANPTLSPAEIALLPRAAAQIRSQGVES
jgi:hypothetical protein